MAGAPRSIPVRRPSFLLLLWTVVLLAPLAWTFSLNVMFPLTDLVCENGRRSLPMIVGLVCLVLAVAAPLLGWYSMTRLRDDPQQESESRDRVHTGRFMLVLGIGIGSLFALVIAMSIVPIFFLSPCPT